MTRRMDHYFCSCPAARANFRLRNAPVRMDSLFVCEGVNGADLGTEQFLQADSDLLSAWRYDGCRVNLDCTHVACI